VLAALAERDGVPLMNLGQKVLLKQPTLTKVIDRMERALLVQRRKIAASRSSIGLRSQAGTVTNLRRPKLGSAPAKKSPAGEGGIGTSKGGG
jgi:hypothetical protein